MGRRAKVVLVGGSVLVALTIGAISAWATATATKYEWYTGASAGSVSTLTGSQSFSVSAGTKLTLSMTILGAPVTMTTSSVICAGCTLVNESPGVATGTGKLNFSSVLTDAPISCKVREGKFNSSQLHFEAHYAEGEGWLMRITPVAGEKEFAFTIPTEGASENSQCGLNTITVLGTSYGRFQAKAGSFATVQKLDLSPTISSSAGSSWYVGSGIPFEITGTLNFEAGGKFFGVK